MDKVKNLPNQLADAGASLISGAPMMLLCYASPTVCAELKNINLRIDQQLKLLTDVCGAMDQYVGSQAEEGVKESHKRAQRECVRRKTEDENVSPPTAITECSNDPGPALMTDIANAWVQDRLVKTPQNVVESLMKSSGQKVAGAIGEENYKFMSAMLGEMKLDVNGKILPVFPANPLVPANVAKHAWKIAIDTICNTISFKLAVDGKLFPISVNPEMQFFERRLYAVIHENIESIDHKNLFDLDPKDRDLVCNALGRSVGKQGILQTAADGESIAASALQNPALSESLRNDYKMRLETVFPALREQALAERVRGIDELRQWLAQMAEAQRASRRLTAKSLSQGQMINDSMETVNNEECDSDETCD
jgi:hypothetical protein